MVASKTLGPWPKGLNFITNRDLSLFLEPSELGEAINITYTPNGFIEPREGFKKFKYNFGSYTTIEVLGELELPTGETVVIVQTVLGTGASRQAKVYRISDKNTCSLILTPAVDVVFTHILSYQSPKGGVYSGVFLFADKVNKSYRNPNFDMSGTWAMIGSSYAVPASNKGFIVKDRLFLFDYTASKMWWSPANYIVDFGLVDQAGYGIDKYSEEPIESTGAADGIRSVEFVNNNFYIFKKFQTYMFTYQALPGEDGYLRKMKDDMGALDSTIFRSSIVVVNTKGVYRLDGTEFIDMQRQLGLRYEIPLDNPSIKPENIFITDFNDNILVGLRDVISVPASPKNYHFVMSGITGAWSQWDFDYAPSIATPGSNDFKAQSATSPYSIVMFNDFTKSNLVYTDYKPNYNLNDYTMDGDTLNTTTHAHYYIPPVVIKTNANFGDSPVKFNKLYRMYIRFYMSDIPKTLVPVDTTLWTISINYNSYKFEYDKDVDGNPKFSLYSYSSEFDPAIVEAMLLKSVPIAANETTVYQRTYQVPISQQRSKEFVVEFRRTYSKLATPVTIVNSDADRPERAGYYFLLSAIWVDYQDKQGI